MSQPPPVNLEIKGFRLVMTCDCFPEQYDVLDNHGDIVGYIRIRHCGCEMHAPDVDGPCIFDCDIMGLWGLTKEERLPVLTRAIDSLIEFNSAKETTNGQS